MRPKTRPGRVGVAEVVRDVGRVEAELARALVDIVAALGDRQRDDADRGVGQPGHGGRRVARAKEVVDERADDARLAGSPRGGNRVSV